MLKVSMFNAHTWDKQITENSRNIHGKFTEEFTAKFTAYFLQHKSWIKLCKKLTVRVCNKFTGKLERAGRAA